MSDVEYRIVVVGTGGVGKSALTVRFIQGTFVQKYDPTIEDSYSLYVGHHGYGRSGVRGLTLQEEYSALRDQYMKTGHGFVLVYSIASKVSFEGASKLRTWILRIKEISDIPIVLVGNKCDLEDERQVTKEEGAAMATRFGCAFFEVSAKTNKRVTKTFEKCVKLIIAWRAKHPETKKRDGKRCTVL